MTVIGPVNLNKPYDLTLPSTASGELRRLKRRFAQNELKYGTPNYSFRHAEERQEYFTWLHEVHEEVTEMVTTFEGVRGFPRRTARRLVRKIEHAIAGMITLIQPPSPELVLR